MDKVNIGIIGFGTIGSGVVKILKRNCSLIQERVGIRPVIAKVADIDITTDRGVRIAPALLTTDAETIINDPQIHIVVELIGGINPAKKYILKSLRKGKAVVTANKALLAEHGEEIFSVANQSNTDIYFEGSVCGGIPIIKVIKEGLVANRIEGLLGIINGTANYILTEMEEKRETFKNALLRAQKEGFAEADPSLDIQGWDAAHKLTILGSLIYGTPLSVEDIYVEGISELTPDDLDHAQEFNCTVKLLGIVKEVKDKKIGLRVHPTLIKRDHPLAPVKGVNNAVFLKGKEVGELLLYGQGAGQKPTASAVVSDIVEVMRNLRMKSPQRVPPIKYLQNPYKIVPIAELVTSYYLRIMAVDQPGVLAQISGILGKYKISIASAFQKQRQKDKAVPIILMTHQCKERDLNTALQEINELPVVKEKVLRIRVES